jgi:hypothetical protein
MDTTTTQAHDRGADGHRPPRTPDHRGERGEGQREERADRRLGAVGVALAKPPSGLTSQLLARGAAGEFRIHEKSMGLRMDARKATDVALVGATLDPGGSTGWHGHPGPSIVIVKSGTVTMYEPAHHKKAHEDDDGREHRQGCAVQSFGPGQAFLHSASVHNFVNSGQGTAEFYVTYLVPADAAPLLRDEPAPPECG